MGATRSEHARRGGFTVAEFLIGILLTLLLSGAALAVALASRGVHDADRERTALNQNLRVGLDLLGNDVRRTGERLAEDVPALEITDGSGGLPDVLVLRRSLIETVLPLCQDVTAGSAVADIAIALASAPPLGCHPVPDRDADGTPDNLQHWASYRVARGGAIRAYLYDPVTRQGEFFLYDAEDATLLTIHRGDGDAWQFGYSIANQSRVYILESRTYQVAGDLLQYFVDDDSGNPRNLIYGVTDFQVTAFMADGSTRAAFGPSDPWADLRSVQVRIVGHADDGERSVDRVLSSRFYPRQALAL